MNDADIRADLARELRERGGLTRADAATAAAIAAEMLGGDPRHIIELRRNGWTLKHPLACRLGDLFACETNRAAVSGLRAAPEEPGQYYIDLIEGVLVIGEVVHD